MHLKRKIVTLVLGGPMAMGGIAFAPPAAAATTIVVDDDGMASATDCNAMAEAAKTIQSGVNMAMPGDTVKVCPGSYKESVTVTQDNVRLRGAKADVDARTRTAPTSRESVISGAGVVATTGGVSLLGNGDALNGFVITAFSGSAGVYTSPAASGYRIFDNKIRDNVFGVYLNSGPAAQTQMQKNLVTRNNRVGAANGNGVYSDQGIENTLIFANKFVRNDNSGVLLASTETTTPRNVIIGRNRFLNHPNGSISFFDGSNIRVSYNTITNTTVNEAGGSAIFVGGASHGINILSNTITRANFSGVAIRDTTDNVDVLSNTVTSAGGNGIDISTTVNGAVNAQKNFTKSNGVDGILLADGTSGNVLRYNTSKYNGGLDCHDLTTGANNGGVANFWSNNVGITASPRGICKPPTS